jgi:hypothetical protein
MSFPLTNAVYLLPLLHHQSIDGCKMIVSCNQRQPILLSNCGNPYVVLWYWPAF